MIELRFPFTAEIIRALKAGDAVLLSDVGFAGRAAAGLASMVHRR
jgi:tartrate dehydratase beta subunit/fumarate hydratase class I family protein